MGHRCNKTLHQPVVPTPVPAQNRRVAQIDLHLAPLVAEKVEDLDPLVVAKKLPRLPAPTTSRLTATI